MSILLAAASLGAEPSPIVHRVEIPHRAGTIEAVYSGLPSVSQRQVGSVGAPGRPSTLRCRWRATLDVERVARMSFGKVTMTRTMAADTPVDGTQAGWCTQNGEAIARAAAARSDVWRKTLARMAERDRALLLAEAETHGGARGH